MFVLDCSVAISWCLVDEHSSYTDKVLDLLVVQQAIVPPLWHLEVFNVLLMAQRRKRIAADNIPLILQTLRGLNITTDCKQIEINSETFLSFSQKHQLTSYDATYLYLAYAENLPLATLDKKMVTVAKGLGLYLKI